MRGVGRRDDKGRTTRAGKEGKKKRTSPGRQGGTRQGGQAGGGRQGEDFEGC